MEGLVRCSANYVPLSPISFLERAALVYRDQLSVVYGNVKYTWRETLIRCTKLASALSHLAISYGDVVAALIPNTPAMYELHFAVPMAGAVLCSLNIRHDSAMLSVLLQHSKAKFIFVDYQFFDTVCGALDIMSKSSSSLPNMVLVLNEQLMSVGNAMPSSRIFEYENLLATGNPECEIRRPKDEWDPIALNYTSGTTSSPKGVVYSHRGAYLNSLATVLVNEMLTRPVFLWTVPMFHCNDWCFTWGVAAQGGTNVCLRNVIAKDIFSKIADHKVTHMGGAPTVLNMIVNSPNDDKKPLPGKVVAITGGAPPTPQVLFKMEELGFAVIHGYGLTEAYGPATVCVWKPEWDTLPPNERAKIKARQGVLLLGLEEVDVKDPVTMKSVPANAKTMGEVMLRGNTIMNGYLKDEKATREAFKDGWYHSGDLGVKYPDGYIQIKDRAKDIIISGGENISSIEIESVIASHPAVLEVAVVARPDDHWGETPCAFIKLKDGISSADVTDVDIMKFCRDRLPHYMAPRTVVFEDLQQTITGKAQKYKLREKTKAMGSLNKTSKL
ncbi:butanoate--CoA ligase AAE1-like [Spinacia oleracea]|uniref:Butanoate--CoA ligase AAE1-like n=1 Tax=Spinacia oleracea TaxID=3562 RepID=A0A9R0I9V2_SPIOL|nr:butanoate--CoA ligase AAE1-like [Spinacia oleracea]XP_056686186.1 butanoate--CoA ligase AAE1-like [Spinacia oleracea]